MDMGWDDDNNVVDFDGIAVEVQLEIEGGEIVSPPPIGPWLRATNHPCLGCQGRGWSVLFRDTCDFCGGLHPQSSRAAHVGGMWEWVTSAS
jgi:hypothetical protein